MLLAYTYRIATHIVYRFNSGNRRYEWDPSKARSNFEKRGIDFASVARFEWGTAVIRRSDRYGEIRFLAYGYVANRIHIVVFAEREDRIRVISFRKADDREERYYVQAQARSHLADS